MFSNSANGASTTAVTVDLSNMDNEEEVKRVSPKPISSVPAPTPVPTNANLVSKLIEQSQNALHAI